MVEQQEDHSAVLDGDYQALRAENTRLRSLLGLDEPARWQPVTPAEVVLFPGVGDRSSLPAYPVDQTSNQPTVKFGTATATVTAFSSQSITAISPPNAAGVVVDVTVQTPWGTSATSPNDQFTPVPSSGYWLVGSDGGIYPFGTASPYGSASGVTSHPVVGMTATPDGNGYWLVATDGGIFSFGDATFYGNTYCLNPPYCSQSVSVNNIVGMSTTLDGRGYWLVASDGGIFSFGDAGFHGSASGVTSHPVVGMAAMPDGGGYWLVGSDGHVYAFGDATNSGSASATSPIVGIADKP